MPTDSAPAPKLNATRARQGRLGKPMLWVLILSTLGAAIVLFGAWAMRSGDIASVEHNRQANTPAEAQRYDTEPSPVKSKPDAAATPGG